MHPLGQNIVKVDADSVGVTKWMHGLLWQCYDGIYHLHTIYISIYSYWNFQSVRVHRSSLKTWKKLIWIWISFPKNYFCQNVISFKFRAIQVIGSVWKPADLFHFYLCQFSPLTSYHISTSITEWQVAYISPPPPPRTNMLIHTPTWLKAMGGGGESVVVDGTSLLVFVPFR